MLRYSPSARGSSFGWGTVLCVLLRRPAYSRRRKRDRAPAGGVNLLKSTPPAEESTVSCEPVAHAPKAKSSVSVETTAKPRTVPATVPQPQVAASQPVVAPSPRFGWTKEQHPFLLHHVSIEMNRCGCPETTKPQIAQLLCVAKDLGIWCLCECKPQTYITSGSNQMMLRLKCGSCGAVVVKFPVQPMIKQC